MVNIGKKVNIANINKITICKRLKREIYIKISNFRGFLPKSDLSSWLI